MRIRLLFAGAFIFLVICAGYLGLTSLQFDAYLNDKAAHFIAFFVLTTTFYWILDTTRRRTLHLTLIVCTGVLGIGSEFLQSFIPNNGRDFDSYDILANIVGSLAAVALSTWYHKRMLERKRANKQYNMVPGDDQDQDLELGEGAGLGTGVGIEDEQESGVVHEDTAPVARSLEAEVDNWDENAEDGWDEDGDGDITEASGPKTPSASSAGDAEHTAALKQRAD